MRRDGVRTLREGEIFLHHNNSYPLVSQNSSLCLNLMIPLVCFGLLNDPIKTGNMK